MPKTMRPDHAMKSLARLDREVTTLIDKCPVSFSGWNQRQLNRRDWEYIKRRLIRNIRASQGRKS